MDLSHHNCAKAKVAHMTSLGQNFSEAMHERTRSLGSSLASRGKTLLN